MEQSREGGARARVSATVRPQRIGFLLLENFTLMAHASAIEPLRMANQLSGVELYQWFTLTDTGEPVCASDGQRIMPDASVEAPIDLDVVIVCGGVAQKKSIREAHLQFLQRHARRGCIMGAVCTGAWALAQAGLLNDHRASIHWECISGLQEAFPRVLVTSRLFTIDRDRVTASGGTAPLDMMLHLIARDHGADLMAAISEMFMCERVRGEEEKQRVPLRHVLGTSQPKLLEIVSLMEANIEEPLELKELAGLADISRRQLERLFLKYLNCSPSKYYLTIRVNRARQLLRQTSMRIIEVATACGFVSTPHFSKCYRAIFGVSPSSERSVDAKPLAGLMVTPTLPSARLFDERVSLRACVPAELARLAAEGESTFGSVARALRAPLS